MKNIKLLKFKNKLALSIAALSFIQNLNASEVPSGLAVADEQNTQGNSKPKYKSTYDTMGDFLKDYDNQVSEWGDQLEQSTTEMQHSRNAQENAKKEKERVRNNLYLNEDTANNLAFKEGNERLALQKEEENVYKSIQSDYQKKKKGAEDRRDKRISTEKDLAQSLANKKEQQDIVDKFFFETKINFKKNFDEITQKESQKSKINVQFIGDVRYNIQKDVLKLMPYFTNKLNGTNILIPADSGINPVVFKKICDFFEAALTKGSDNQILVSPNRNSKYQYLLFKKNSNFIQFFNENREVINVLKKIELWDRNIRLNGYDYSYNKASSSAEDLKIILIYQLNLCLGKNYNYAKSLEYLSDLDNYIQDNINKNDIQSFAIVFNEITKGASSENLVSYAKNLKSINSVYYQDLTDIVHLVYTNNQQNIFEELFNKLSPQIYRFFAIFLRRNPNFFSDVPIIRFFERCNKYMTDDEFTDLISRMNRDYMRGGGNIQQGTTGQAHEIHQFADLIVKSDGKKLKFNDAVLQKIKENNRVRYPYDTVKEILDDIFKELIGDPLKSDAISKIVYNSVIEKNNDFNDQVALSSVVTYLITNDPSKGTLKSWLYVFMDESKKAYDRSGNTESCVKGIKERVITSLRSAIPEDPIFLNIFGQAEKEQMLKVKKAHLGNIRYWVKKLYTNQVRSDISEKDAQEKLKTMMEEYYSDIKNQEINEGIQNIVGDEFFLTVMDGDKVLPGLWVERFLPELIALERSNAPINFGDDSSSSPNSDTEDQMEP